VDDGVVDEAVVAVVEAVGVVCLSISSHKRFHQQKSQATGPGAIMHRFATAAGRSLDLTAACVRCPRTLFSISSNTIQVFMGSAH
jgi:hypothetical protein